MALLKTKGDLAELKVATDLVARGCRLSLPYGEDHDYDLVADYEGRLHRVQVKHTKSDGRVIKVKVLLALSDRGQDPIHQALHGGDGRLDRRV